VTRTLFAAAPSSLRRLEGIFTPITRVRGVDYATRGFVRIVRTTPEAVIAEVRGQQRYDVELHAVDSVLRASCSCPHFLGGDACKHVWATLLVAERDGVLPHGDELRSIEIDVSAGDATDDDNKGRDGDERDRGPTQITPAIPKRPSTRGPEASWRDLMAARAASARPPEPGRSTLRFVLDPVATKARGSLVVRVVERVGPQNAGLWRPARIGRPWGSFVPESDAWVLGLLDAASQAAGGHGAAHGALGAGTFSVGRASRELLERLVASGRAYLGEPDRVPLRWDPEPYSLALAVTQPDEGDTLRVRAILERADEAVPACDPELVLIGGFAFWADRVAPFDDRGHFAWLAEERASQPAALPIHEVDDFIDALFRAPRAPRLTLPPEHAVPEVHGAGRPYALLQTNRQAAIEGGQRVEAGFDYDGVRVPLDTRGSAVFDRARRRLVVRDAGAEDTARGQLEAVGVRPLQHWQRRTAERCAHRIALGKVEPAARALVGLGWRIEVNGTLRRSAGAFAVSVSTGIDWLEVGVQARFDGIDAAFPELLAALRQKRRNIVLADGSVGELSDDQIEKLRRWVAMAAPRDDGLRFHKVQAPLVAALLESERLPTFDAGFAALRRDVHAFADITPLDPPRTFQGSLREYQRHALGWFKALRQLGFGGCLADDMGLGKTVQVLAMLDARRQERPAPGPSLVVAPRSVLFNWAAEVARFAPRLRVLEHDGPTRADPGGNFGDYDLVLTTYGLLRSDLEALSQLDFDYVILDEAQAIKTARTATAQAARALRARHRLALTGTPVENHLGELAALLDFLNPGLLGASNALSTLAQGTHRIDDATRDVLARAVRPFFLRRTKRQVAPELPDRIEQTISCELEGEQRRRYDQLHGHYRRSLGRRVARDGVARSTAHILEALLRLRQAACHPGLIDEGLRGEPSAKLDVLLQHLDALRTQGQKALVFSQFTSLLSIVRDRLERSGIEYEYLDGATTDRAGCVARFQSDARCSVFLLSLKAGGTGLNLTAAEYVFLLDPWWNPAVEAQAIDRAHRIGQARTVLAYRLIARGTVEEKVAQLQSQKRELADALFGEGGAAVGGLTRADLELLLS
jgi:superfamily II DNA or RNA helicase